MKAGEYMRRKRDGEIFRVIRATYGNDYIDVSPLNDDSVYYTKTNRFEKVDCLHLQLPYMHVWDLITHYTTIIPLTNKKVKEGQFLLKAYNTYTKSFIFCEAEIKKVIVCINALRSVPAYRIIVNKEKIYDWENKKSTRIHPLMQLEKFKETLWYKTNGLKR